MWKSGWILIIPSHEICLKTYHLWSKRYVSSHTALRRLQILFVYITKCEKTRPSAPKSDVAPRCTSRAFAHCEFPLGRWRFSFRRTKKRRNTRVQRKAELESRFQMINNRSSRQVYMPFSISIESSWACAFNCSIVMTVSISRVRWNRSSTASLEGKRSDERRREY